MSGWLTGARFRQRVWTGWLLALAMGAGGAAMPLAAAAWGAMALTPESVVAGALGGLAVEGWRRQLQSRSEATKHAARVDEIVAEADRRATNLWEEGHRLRLAKLASRKLSGYLSSDLVARILHDPSVELTLGGERIEAAVLFVDIVGFTPRCERMEPESVVQALNTWFSYADPVFQRYGAIIDKRMGDGIMVVFVPKPGVADDDLRQRSVACGLALQRAARACSQALCSTGREPLAVRVGVACGSLVQGNMGSEVKLEYTVIGDIVNLASRLDGAASPGRVIVERSSMAHIEQGYRQTDQRSLRVKGKSHLVEVVELEPT